MPNQDLASKTVAELRKMAKEYGVTLGAGIQKAGIIAKLEAALGDDEATAPEAGQPAPEQAAVPQAPSAPPAEPKPQQSAAAPQGQVQFRAAWRNPAPTNARYGGKAGYGAPRSPGTWQSTPARPLQQDMPPRIGGTVRPANYTPRFGPEANQEQSAPRQEDSRGYGSEPARPAYQQRTFDQRPADDQRFRQRPAYEQRGYDRSAPDPRGGYGQTQSFDGGYGQRQGYQSRNSYGGYYNAELGTSNPAVSELLAAGECTDDKGVLEIHPDGYGFLRNETFQPSSRDIYVSMAQIKRFGLRNGDLVEGKTRPKREGDKYTAMLYITGVNGVVPDELQGRVCFDELTPMYATRRISLDQQPDERCDAARLVDLVAPLGFGQRGLILCPPECGKSELLTSLANTVSRNHPDAVVLMLLVEEFPEDVTLIRERARCTVLASTFDQPPESHLRLADMALEYAERQVEQKKDVVLIVDSLTRLAKTFTTASAQQGRYVPGQVNPASLMRAKRMFGAARSLKEGGSLTVLGAMNVDNGNRVDDVVVEEFKGTANMELWLDSAIARTGLTPPVNIQLSGTRRAELLLSEDQQRDLKLLRSAMGSMNPNQALAQLLDMIAKTSSNTELLSKLKDWVELMKNGRPAGN